MIESKFFELLEVIINSRVQEGTEVSAKSLESNYAPLFKSIITSRPPSPTERHALAAQRHIDDVCKERDRMARELADAGRAHSAAIQDLRRELTARIEAYRERLDWFEPHYEGLKRDYENIKSFNPSSLGMITVGGVLLGSAGFLPSDVYKYGVLAAGIVATFYGLWAQFQIVRKSPPAKERPPASRLLTET